MRLKILLVTPAILNERFDGSGRLPKQPLRLAKRRLIFFQPLGDFSPLLLEIGDPKVEFLQFNEGGKL